MEPQVDGTPPTFAKSKQFQPAGQVAQAPQVAPAGHGPHAQSMSLGRQFMTTVVPQVGSGGGGQVPPTAQTTPEAVHQLDSLTFTHW
jgi:hypothetical protein